MATVQIKENHSDGGWWMVSPVTICQDCRESGPNTPCAIPSLIAGLRAQMSFRGRCSEFPTFSFQEFNPCTTTFIPMQMVEAAKSLVKIFNLYVP
jgi:hypothetical protein